MVEKLGSKTFLEEQVKQYQKELKWIKKEFDELKLHRTKLSIVGEMSNSLNFELKSNLQDLVLSLEVIKELSKDNLDPEIKNEYSRIEKVITKMIQKVEESHHFLNKNPIIFHKISLKEIIGMIKKDLDIPSGIKILQESNFAIICDPQLMVLAFSVIITKLIQKLNGNGEISLKVKQYNDINEVTFEIPGEPFSDDEMVKLFDPYTDNHLCCSNVSLESAKNIIENHGGMIQLKNNPTRIVLKFLYSVESPNNPLKK